MKNLLLKNDLSRKALTYVEASSYSVGSGLFKSWSLGEGWGYNGEIDFYIRLYRDNLKNPLLENHLARKAQTCVEASSDSVDSSLLKSWSLGVGRGHNGEVDFYIGSYRKNL